MRPAIPKALTILAATFRSNAKSTPERQAQELAWEQALSGLSDAEIELGVSRALQEHKPAWMPTPAQIIGWAHGQDLDASRDSGPNEALDPSLWEFALDPNYHRPLVGEDKPPPGEVWYHPNVKGLYRNPKLNWKHGGFMSKAEIAMTRDEYIRRETR